MWQNRRFIPRKQQSSPETQNPPPRPQSWRQFFTRFYRRLQIPLFISVGVIIALLGLLLYSHAQPPPQKITQRDIDNAVNRALASASPTPSFESQVYQVIQPSVVSIDVVTKEKDGKKGEALGTGVVVDDTGSILTCLHVVDDATQISVTFFDGTESRASITAKQAGNDMALLLPEVIPDNLIPATLASASVLNVGDQVVAVGNPFGIVNSVSSGVVSGLNRNFKSPETGQSLGHLIQFDAAVNPGRKYLSASDLPFLSKLPAVSWAHPGIRGFLK